MQDILSILDEKYGLESNEIIPDKEDYIIGTTKGKKVFKKSRFSNDRICFIHKVKEHLYRNGFKNTDRYICTQEGLPYVKINEAFYTLANQIEGKLCILENRDDVTYSARTLAMIHKASKGFNRNEGFVRIELGRLPSVYIKRLAALNKFYKSAEKRRDKFDCIFLDYFKYYYELGEKSLSMLSDPRYKRVAEKTAYESIVCHHDYNYNNILFSNGQCYVVNFDFCCVDLKAYDIANFMRRKMRKCSWNLKEAKCIIDEYRKIENLSEEDFFILKVMLMFPQKFWRVANGFYNSRNKCNQKFQLEKLMETVNEKGAHSEFIGNFEILTEL